LDLRPEAEGREESVILRRDERVMGWRRDRCVKVAGVMAPQSLVEVEAEKKQPREKTRDLNRYQVDNFKNGRVLMYEEDDYHPVQLMLSFVR